MSQTMDSFLALASEKHTVYVLPGHQERLTLTVTNKGSLPLSLELVVQGFFESWMTLQPQVMVLSANQAATSAIIILPPADAPLGSYPISILARARDNSNITARVDLVLVLGESIPDETEQVTSQPPPKLDTTAPPIIEPVMQFGGPLELSLIPPTQTTNKVARFSLRLSNRGTTPLDVVLTPSDPSGVYAIEVRPAQLSLAQRSEGTVQVITRPLTPLQQGEVRRISHFTVEASAKNLAEPVMIDGTLTQISRPWWKGPLGFVVLAGAIIILALAVYLLWHWLANRPDEPRPTPEPTAIVVPTATPSPTSTETATAAPTEIPTFPVYDGTAFDVEGKNENINVRNGPGLNYTIIAKLKNNTPVKISGRSEDSKWLWITDPASGTEGWVSATYTQTTGDIQALPVVNKVL
ncbi:MAG: SH3 domain-containing protein [Anaerolineae bacterium]